MERRRFLVSTLAAGAGSLIHPKTVLGQAAAEATIITAEEAPVYSQGLGEARILVGGAQSDGAWWLGRFREDPGFMTPLHVHPDADEEFLILDGVLSIHVDGAWHDLSAGTIAMIPRGLPHAQGNTGQQPAHFIGSGRPAGFERFFPELNELVSRVPPSDPSFRAEVIKVITRHGTTVLGPPPPRV